MFDTKRFLKEKFVAPNELVATFHRYGLQPPKENTVQQWFQRASVPSTWFPVLLAVLELQHGTPVSIVEYVEG